jgi:hypothetical protein
MWRLVYFLFIMTPVVIGSAPAGAEPSGELAANLASQWRLVDDAVVVVDSQTKKPLLCVAAVRETGDTMVTEKTAELTCRARIARWLGGERWVRIAGLMHRWSGGPPDQLIVLFAFADPSGPSDDEVARWLTLALDKKEDGPPAQVEVRRGLTGVQP